MDSQGDVTKSKSPPSNEEKTKADKLIVTLEPDDQLIDLKTPVVDTPAPLGDPLTPTVTSAPSDPLSAAVGKYCGLCSAPVSPCC